MKEWTRRFVRERETKNMVRFNEEQTPGEPPVVGTLYAAKWAVGDTQVLEVTIKEIP